MGLYVSCLILLIKFYGEFETFKSFIGLQVITIIIQENLHLRATDTMQAPIAHILLIYFSRNKLLRRVNSLPPAN